MNLYRFIAGSIAAVALFAASPALAADKSDQLVSVLKIDETLETTFVALAPLFGAQVIAELERQPSTKAMVTQFAANGRSGRERMEAILGEEFMSEMRKSFPQIKARMAEIYRAKLSETELDALLQFYSSSAGAKLMAIQADLASTLKQEGEKIGAKAGMAAMPRAFERIEAELAR